MAQRPKIFQKSMEIPQYFSRNWEISLKFPRTLWKTPESTRNSLKVVRLDDNLRTITNLVSWILQNLSHCAYILLQVIIFHSHQLTTFVVPFIVMLLTIKINHISEFLRTVSTKIQLNQKRQGMDELVEYLGNIYYKNLQSIAFLSRLFRLS